MAAAVLTIGGNLGPAASASNSVSSEAPSADVFIVVFDADVNLRSEIQQRKSTGIQITNTFRHALKGMVAELTPAEVADLRSDRDVVSVTRDRSVSIMSAAPITRDVGSWGQDRIDQRELPLDGKIASPSDGHGVDAYVIDTGIRLDHLEFAGRVSNDGFSVIQDGRGWTDCHGHGTHVGGTIAGSTYGVAPAARVVAIRVLDCSGWGTMEGVISGLDWAVAHHQTGQPAVANLSLGGGAYAPMNAAVAGAVADGIVVAAAAGNRNEDACKTSPASAPEALTVASTTSSDERSYFSNYGTCVDLFAPGSNIKSAWHSSSTSTNYLSGTSMATPHVAGAVALLLSGTPQLTPTSVEEEIEETLATPGRVTNPGSDTPNLLLHFPKNRSFIEPPELTSNPVGITNSNSAIIEFTLPNGATAQCKLDSAAWFDCNSPQRYLGLSDGPHEFKVKSLVEGSGASAAQAARWTVDTAIPSPPTISPTSTQPWPGWIEVSIQAEDLAEVECRLDGPSSPGTWNSCFGGSSGSVTRSMLPRGNHSLLARQRDRAGNVSPPAIHDFTVEGGPRILMSPPRLTNESTVTFGFESTPGTHHSRCSLAPRLPLFPLLQCASPMTYTLRDGEYYFGVWDFDSTSRTSMQETFAFTIDTRPPKRPQILSGPRTTSNPKPTFRFTSSEEDVRFECAFDSSKRSRCSSPYSSRKALARGAHSLRLWAIDKAGNRSLEALREFRVSR